MIKKTILALSALFILTTPAPAQPGPGPVPSPWTVNGSAIYRANGQVGIGTVSPNVNNALTVAPTGTGAGINLVPGSAPTNPNNGDMWTTAAGLYVQINGSVVGPLVATCSVATASVLGCVKPDGTTLSNTTGAIGVNLGHANTWTATQSFPQINLNGSSSGAVSLIPQTAAGTYNFNYPTSAGAAGQVLESGGGGSAPMAFGNFPVNTVATVAAMEALGALAPNNPVLYVQAYNNPAGGGYFLWVPSNNQTTDSCTVFNATGIAPTVGQFVRANITAGRISVEQCGAFGNGTAGSLGTDDVAAVQAASNYFSSTGHGGRGGIVSFGSATYNMSSASVTMEDGGSVYDGMTWQGTCPFQGTILNSSVQCTMLVTSANTPILTYQMYGLTLRGIIWAAPQPIIEAAGISPSGGAIQSAVTVWPGIGLTSGTYTLTWSGGGCTTPPTGTVTVSGGVAGQPSMSGLGVGCTTLPQAIVSIPGGGQVGALIRQLSYGNIKWEDNAFISDGFGRLSQSSPEVLRALTGSFSNGDTVLPETNTSGYTVGMVCTDITFPPALRHAGSILSIQSGVSITVSTGALSASFGSSDEVYCGTQVQGVGFYENGDSYYGQSLYATYDDYFDSEATVINRVNYEGEGVSRGAAFFTGSAQFDFSHNRAENYFEDHTLVWWFSNGPPTTVFDNSVGNVDGPSADTTGFYINGYAAGTVSGENQSSVLISGNIGYGPLPVALWLEGVQWAHVGPNIMQGTTYNLKTDAGSVCNVLEMPADETNISGYTTTYSLGSTANWIKSAFGETPPYEVDTATTFTPQACTEVIDAYGASSDQTITIPTYSGSSPTPVGGRSFTVSKISGNAQTVTIDGPSVTLAGGAVHQWKGHWEPVFNGYMTDYQN